MDALRLAPSLVLACLAGCASTAGPAGARHGSDGVAAWPLGELAAAAAHSPLVLYAAGRPLALVAAAPLRAAWTAATRVRTVAGGAAAELVVVEGDQPNAYSFVHDERPKIAVSLGMLRLLGDDEAAWAALLGHEQAHLELRHREARRQRQAAATASSEWLGIALTLVGVPLAAVVADAGTAITERGYSRDDEREADRIGAETMIRAGYDLDGAIRLQERLAAAGDGAALPFLSTHPSGAERIETMRRLRRESQGAGK